MCEWGTCSICNYTTFYHSGLQWTLWGVRQTNVTPNLYLFVLLCCSFWNDFFRNYWCNYINILLDLTRHWGGLLTYLSARKPGSILTVATLQSTTRICSNYFRSLQWPQDSSRQIRKPGEGPTTANGDRRTMFKCLKKGAGWLCERCQK